MGIEERKYKMIEKLLKVKEEETIYHIESILDNELSKNYWDELSPEVKKAIDIGIEQSANGQIRPHEEIMAEIKKKYNTA